MTAVLAQVCRYMLRPPFARDAVKALPDGRVHVLFKAPPIRSPWFLRHGSAMMDVFIGG